ncbi:SusC/RagA family TonB-linked outer membrane protein [Pedobacter aquatilis]|uniref:SusC/RagA family TonB-linked outer membrane protein n=1 Tax=Pedobacter aquatilis TaxID=351343 RepID=UPI00292CB2E3|nr:SusC/RagA family TonB-linked outer membrane protein [Pedobacter aquatilis]
MKKTLLCIVLFCSFIFSAMAQNKTLSGKVIDKDGVGIPGVTISIENRSVGQTNATGNYSASVPDATKSLTFSFIGYETITSAINGTELNVKLLESASKVLNEVVITGYGVVERKKFSGATANISGGEVSKQTFGSFDQALQGAASGVTVVANGGQPGQQAVVRIRGNGSINGVNTPLYIVDGIEISAADFQSMNQGDFENIEVLKDAISTGVYGSRGANGVFVITTKRGKAGQVQFNYDLQLGRSKMPEDRLIVMNSQQKIDYELARGNPYGWTAAEAENLRNVNFSWKDALFQTGQTQQHQISANGGNEATKFYASLSYLDQEGIVQTTGLKRYTARANVDNTVKNWRFGLGLQGGFSNRVNTSEANTVLSSPLNAIRWSNPYETAYLPDGSFNESGGPNTGQLASGQPNGAMELFLNYNNNRQLKGVATSYVEYHIPAVDGLFLRTNWGVDYTQNENAAFTDPRTSTGIARQGILTRSLERNFRYTGTTSLNYSKKIKEHEFSAGLFTEVVKNDYRTFGFTGYGFTNGFTNEAGITPGTATTPNYIPAVNGSGTQNGLMSFFLTANYGYAGKYYLNLVGRRDGSSRFGADNKWANFGSAGAIWVINEENFMKSVTFINSLRLRASYGTTGNNGSADYPLAQFGRVAYAGVGGWSPTTPGNPLLTWETNTTTNIGLDFAVAKNRISGTIEVYNRKTTDQFYSIPVDPSAGGFTSITSNFGSVTNKGVEITLRGDIIRSKDFKWSMEGNISYNRNRITSLPQDSVISGVTILAQGSPVNSLYLVPYAGVDPATGNALYTKRNGTVTSVFNVADKVVLGTSDAPWFGGISTRFSYKGFDLSAQLNFFLDRYMYNNDLNNILNPTYYFDNMHISMLDEWRTPGQITDTPRPSSTGGNSYQAQTTRFIDDASFWRLRNVTLGYTVPQAFMQKIKIRSARIFVQGQNLWTSTKFRGFDPEATGTSLTGAQYPSLIQGTLGLTIGF